MYDDRHSLFAWLRDIALAYAGGLVLGGPLAVAAVWLTGIERLTTVCLLAAMAGVFVTLRRPARDGARTSDTAAHGARPAVTPGGVGRAA